MSGSTTGVGTEVIDVDLQEEIRQCQKHIELADYLKELKSIPAFQKLIEEHLLKDEVLMAHGYIGLPSVRGDARQMQEHLSKLEALAVLRYFLSKIEHLGEVHNRKLDELTKAATSGEVI